VSFMIFTASGQKFLDQPSYTEEFPLMHSENFLHAQNEL
jgi:hypothetical protein